MSTFQHSFYAKIVRVALALFYSNTIQNDYIVYGIMKLIATEVCMGSAFFMMLQYFEGSYIN